MKEPNAPQLPNRNPDRCSKLENPSALDHVDEIAGTTCRRLAIFLDYDGTLTPIVDRPEQAILSGSMRQTLKALTAHSTVAILSGRDLDDIRRRVEIDGIIYAGSHGFDIIGPHGLRKQVAVEFLPVLDLAENELRPKLAGISGALLERKRFSIAAHYRLADENGVAEVMRAVNEVAHRHRELRVVAGKKLYELQPDIDWNKGRALIWLMEMLGLTQRNARMLYIGDDLTDEDAFRALGQVGTSIIVTEQPRPTAADYSLRTPAEVEHFLHELARLASIRAGSQD
jgi:trehalose-phosphatase